jgi:hypothetical protein
MGLFFRAATEHSPSQFQDFRISVLASAGTASSGWLAERVLRRRAVPRGTVGERITGARKPASASAADAGDVLLKPLPDRFPLFRADEIE